MAKPAQSKPEHLQVLTWTFTVLYDKKVAGLRTQSQSPSHGPPSCLRLASLFNQPVVSLMTASKPSSCANSSDDADICLLRTGLRLTAPFVSPQSLHLNYWLGRDSNHLPTGERFLLPSWIPRSLFPLASSCHLLPLLPPSGSLWASWPFSAVAQFQCLMPIIQPSDVQELLVLVSLSFLLKSASLDSWASLFLYLSCSCISSFSITGTSLNPIYPSVSPFQVLLSLFCQTQCSHLFCFLTS